MLTVDPMIPPVLWATLCVLGVAALVVYGWRRPGGVGRGRWVVILSLMAGAMFLVLAVLLNPLWAQPVPPPPGKPLITLLVDDSASMATPDAGGGGRGSRYMAAVEAARLLERDAGDAFDVRVRRFDEKVSAATIAELAEKHPEGQLTDVAGAIFASIEADRPQGQAVVVLTDAIQTADSGAARMREAARFAKAAGVPIYGEVFGGQAGGVDVGIESRSPRDLAYIGQKVMLGADIRAHGYTGAAVVRLLSDGKEISKQTVQLTADAPTSVRFEVEQDKTGLYPYELKVDPLAGELTDANNSALCLLRVVDKPVKVMLLEGKPYWDSKFLMRHLAADASVEMHSLVQVAPGRVIARTVRRGQNVAPPHAGADEVGINPGMAETAQPVQDTWQIDKDPGAILADPASLSGVQVLILGRDTQDFLTDAALANIQHWLSKEGGALICYRGAPAAQIDQTLARLLPVRWQPARETRFQLKLTDTGRELNWFGGGSLQELGGLPLLASAEQVQNTKPLAVVVAQAGAPARGGGGKAGPGGAAEDAPVVTYQPYGAGRVVVIEGAGMWRWAFPPPRPLAADARSSEDIYATVWHALFRWIISDAGLVPGETAAIRPDKTSFNAREPAAASLLVRLDAGATTKPLRQASPTVLLKLAGSSEAPREIVCEAAGDDPGAFRVNFGMLPPGRYEATLSGDKSVSALFDVQRFGEEQLNLAARPDVMAQLAADSGGTVLSAATVHELIPQFREHLAKSRPPRVAYTTAWDRWWVFAVVLGCWAAAWTLRRSSGLV